MALYGLNDAAELQHIVDESGESYEVFRDAIVTNSSKRASDDADEPLMLLAILICAFLNL